MRCHVVRGFKLLPWKQPPSSAWSPDPKSPGQQAQWKGVDGFEALHIAAVRLTYAGVLVIEISGASRNHP